AARAQGSVAIAVATDAPEAALSECVGIALALAPGQACYVPFAHRAPSANGGLDLAADAPAQLRRDDVLARLKPLLEDESVLKIGHNVKFDIEVLADQGMAVAPSDCSMLVSFVLECAAHGQEIETLAKLHFDLERVAYKEITGTGKDQVGFGAV